MNGQLHYACHVQLRSLKPTFNRTSLLRFIRGWIANRHRLDWEHPLRKTSKYYTGLTEPWFFIPGNSSTLETGVFAGNGSPETPEYWALRYRHPDLGTKPLMWTCDLLVRQLSEHLDFRLRIRHQASDSWNQALTPEHRVPGIVHHLLDGRDEWLCFAGTDPLPAGPVLLAQNGLDIFLERLFASERQIPFLLITPTATGEWLADARVWAEQLAGVAKVWQVTDQATCQELDRRLPPAYACFPGAIRLYLPGARPGRDARPHQYLPANRLRDTQAQQQALSETLRLLARRSWEIPAKDEILDLDQLRGLVREQELARYKQELIEATLSTQALDHNPEYTRLLEQEVEDLQLQLNAERRRSSELQNRAVQLEYLLQERNRDHDLGEQLQRLPENLLEMLELIQRLYPHRLGFTDRARKSAQAAAFNQSRRLSDAWRVLWHMANTLYDLYFNQDGVNLEAEFQRLSGFGLTLTEGRMTRADKKLMALREDSWNGERIVIEPHIKLGNEVPNLLRVHYASLQTERLLVIGHMGDHMTNRTTVTRF